MIRNSMDGSIEIWKTTCEKIKILWLLTKKFGTFCSNSLEELKFEGMELWLVEMTRLLKSTYKRYTFLTYLKTQINRSSLYCVLETTQFRIYLISFDNFERFKIQKIFDFGKFGDLKTLKSITLKWWMSIKNTMKSSLKVKF